MVLDKVILHYSSIPFCFFSYAVWKIFIQLSFECIAFMVYVTYTLLELVVLSRPVPTLLSYHTTLSFCILLRSLYFSSCGSWNSRTRKNLPKQMNKN